VKSLVVVLSAIVLIAVAAVHAYRAYAGMPLMIAHHDVPILASWICAGVTGVLGLLLLAVARK
jgi:hypothetical protein